MNLGDSYVEQVNGRGVSRYFASVFTVEDTLNIPLILKNMREELSTITITGEIVLDKLMGLKSDKSPGPDGLHS